MTLEQAIAAVEFWTTLADSAIGSTTDPELGAYFEVPEKSTIPREAISNPNGPRVYAIRIPRWSGDRHNQIETIAYRKIVQEIERRR